MKYHSRLDRNIQLLIPPSLVILLVFTITELFYGVSSLGFLVDLFDVYVMIIFGIDLHYRRKDHNTTGQFVKAHILDIIATIPFNLIFYGIEGLVLVRGARGVRLLTVFAKFARFSRFFRFMRIITRLPRFLRLTKYTQKHVRAHRKTKLKGTLSFKVILLITVNSIMGTGIYFLTAAGARHAGPASLIAWGVLSLIALYISMCFSELVSMFPKAGGIYEFAKQAYGRFWSFIIGWVTSIAGSVTIAMLLLGALQYILPNHPKWYIPIAFMLIILFNYIAYRGTQTSTIMLVGFALVTLVTVISLIVPGMFAIDPTHFEPFFVFPVFSILLSIFFICETFFGWESALFLAAETKNPTRVMPRALIGGTVIIAILAFFLSLVGMGAIHWEEYGTSVAPLRDLGAVLFGQAGSVIFTVLVFVSIIGAVACWVVTCPRLLMAIAEDKLFFVQFARVHPKHNSPYVSVVFQAVILSVLVYLGSGSYETLLHMLLPLILFLYSMVILSLVVLRIKQPDAPRPYRAPFGMVGPIMTVAFMVALLIIFVIETHSSLDILKISGSIAAFGMPAYFFIEMFYLPQYVSLRRNLYAKLRHMVHALPQPTPYYKKMIQLCAPFDKKSIIVDRNSPVNVAARMIVNGRYEFKSLSVVNKLQEELKHFKESVKDERIQFMQVKSATHVFIYKELGVAENPDKCVKQLAALLKKGGKFCLYESYNFVDMMPNALLIEDKKKIQALFKKYGLEASTIVKRTLTGRKFFIHGKKK